MPVPVGAPPDQKWEVEFTPGVWTDVTADVEFAFSQPQTHYGRTSQFSQPGPGSETFALRNQQGRYTPQRQVLTDGTTPHPFWPNVLPRKRIRRSYTVAGVTYYRFYGYIKGFPPSLYSGVLPIVPITATTRDDQLSRVKMLSPIHEQIGQQFAVSPQLWWPLTDAADSTQAVQVARAGGAAGTQPGTYPLAVAGDGAALTFGDNGPGAGDGTGVKFAPGSATSGKILKGSLPVLNWDDYTVECWVNTNGALASWGIAGFEQILTLKDDTGSILIALYLDSGKPAWSDDTASITAAGSINDGGGHHIAVTRNSVSHVVTLYVDGVSAGTTSSSFALVPTTVVVGAVSGAFGGGWFQGNIGEVAAYTVHTGTQLNMTLHAQATNGYSGDTTDARIARWLRRASVPTAEQTLDAGQTTVGTYPQNGKDVISACQDMATTEGGVFWFRWDGQARFANRRFRDSTTPVLILDASVPALLDPDVWDPAFDETTLVNSATANRSAESGTLSTQTYTVDDGGYGESDAPEVATYALSDQDALNLAQAQVAGNSQPRFRLDQLAVNFHASPVSLYPQLGATEIGSRIRIINVPSFAAPTGTIDLFAEGWTEYPNPNTYRVVFDTSPVGVERMKLDDPVYGKLGCDGQTLNAALPASSSPGSVVIATAAGKPTFTTVSGEYPTKIKVGEEVITLPTAPGGATSPQTFTGCLRGQQGTFPAAQAAGSVVTLWPQTGLAL